MTAFAWVSLAGGLVGIIVSITVLINFGVARRKAAMEEGKREARFERAMEDLERAFTKIHALEAGDRKTGESLVKIETMLENIEKSLDELSRKFDRHCESEDDGR